MLLKIIFGVALRIYLVWNLPQKNFRAIFLGTGSIKSGPTKTIEIALYGNVKCLDVRLNLGRR